MSFQLPGVWVSQKEIPVKLISALLLVIVAQISYANSLEEEGLITETAIVENVFKTTDSGFTCIYYLITWHGQKTIVDDPIYSTDFKIGDKLGVLVMKHDMSKDNSGQKILHLTVLPYVPAPRPK